MEKICCVDIELRFKLKSFKKKNKGKLPLKGGMPMEQFLLDIVSQVLSGILLALIFRYFNG